MVDNLTEAQRERAMRAVKSRDTSAELIVRSICREMGERGYRLHRRDLPGTPDLAFIGRKLAVFVHGCFWHGHECPAGAKTPQTNAEYWEKKIGRNRIRDAENNRTLTLRGWRPLIIWECEVKNRGIATKKLRSFFKEATPQNHRHTVKSRTQSI